MRFSQKIGKRPIRTVLQIESIDNDLHNRLWNTVLENFFDRLNSDSDYVESQKGEVCKLIWKEFYNFPIDEIPSYSNSRLVYVKGFIEYLRKWFFKVEWFEVYDFIEFIAFLDSRVVNTDFTKYCNQALEKEVAGYRIVNEKVVQITSEEEVLAIEEAINSSDHWNSVNTHLRAALDGLANRKSPDHRNSIKESISAVEAFCKIVTKEEKATLGKALAVIENRHQIHGSLITAFAAIYGYTSDSGGIRHALLETDVKVELEDAKFMLVACSAFINYLKTKVKL